MMRRRAVILPFVLVMIALLALTIAGFAYFVRAESAGLSAHADQQQARLAADSGLEEVTAVLRVAKHDAAQWSDVPSRFRHALVWSPAYKRDSDPVREKGSRKELIAPGIAPRIAWRYSVCGPRLDAPNLNAMRYGITPESAKLNLNTATAEQLTALCLPLLLALQIENGLELVNAAIDWRDENTDALPGGAENEYYNALTPAYSVKNAPFDTLEELLLVRGWNAIALYGEDANRNGLLDPNEDDGDASSPFFDNGDGVLNLGVAPFLTVATREPDTTLANKPRVNLVAAPAAFGPQIQKIFPNGEISAATIGFVTQLASSGFDFRQLTSPAQLYAQGYIAPPPIDSGEEEGQPASQPASGPSSQPAGAPGVLPQELLNSPVTLEEMPYIMDVVSTRDPQSVVAGGIQGLININVAPPQVLALIPGLTPEAIGAIIGTRQTLTPEQLRTTAWPLVAGVVDTATFHRIAPYITTKAYQFHVEIVGYADHSKVARRFEWQIEMIGPLAQVRYFRELTGLGIAWPVDRDSIVTAVR